MSAFSLATSQTRTFESRPGLRVPIQSERHVEPVDEKKPFMSMWLRGANAVANRVRGHATAAAKRQGAALAKDIARVWSRAWLTAITPKRRR
jgi:hypothetical protein